MLRRQIEQECNALEINRIAVSSSADTSDGAGASQTYHHLNLGTAYRTGLVCRELNFFIAREIKNDVKDEAVAAKIMAHAMDESTDIAMESGLIQ